jgi:hypothetical protein
VTPVEFEEAIDRLGSVDHAGVVKTHRFDLPPGEDAIPWYKLCRGWVVVYGQRPGQWPDDVDVHVRLHGLSAKRFEAAVATILLKENCTIDQMLFWYDDKWRPKKRSRK